MGAMARWNDGVDLNAGCSIAEPLAAQLRAAREAITRRWLARIVDRVTVDIAQVFPSEELINHVPLLISAVADFMEDPAEDVTTTEAVVAKAVELGELRYRQGFGPQQILKEFEILGGIILAELTETAGRITPACSPSEVFVCAHRLHRALAAILQVTTTHYLRLMDARVNEREQRLRGFNRMVSHELKNRAHAAQSAASVLREGWYDEPGRERLLRIVSENLDALGGKLNDLLELSRIDPTARRQRNVLLESAVAESIRHVRDLARDRDVTIRIAGELPRIEVNSAAVELCLSNYLSNAVKYSDVVQPVRWVEICAFLQEDERYGGELIVEVRDNGLGVPEAARSELFKRFFRAHSATKEEGSGLGLSLVRETVEALGGRAWASFDCERGSCFAFALPSRRREDGP